MAEMSPKNSVQPVGLGGEALERIAGTLADLYFALYEERAGDPRASLTGNMLAFVFEGGLSVADGWLLGHGHGRRLREFRRTFFEVVSDDFVGVVADLTDLPVTSSFYGFDPTTRTTHAIFVLDLSRLGGSEERQAVRNWSEQVRRNAARLRQEHRDTIRRYAAAREEWRHEREAMQRARPPEGEPRGRGAEGSDEA